MGEISSLAKQVAKESTATDNGTLMYGTVADGGVKLDGASVVTPATFAVEAKVGERVMCRILNHTVTVTSNVTDPSAGSEKVEEISGYALDAHNILVKIADDKTEADEIVEAIQGKFTEATSAAASAQESADQAIKDAETANKEAANATLYAKDALDKAGIAEQAAKDAAAAQASAEESASKADTAASNAEVAAGSAQSAQEAVNTAISNIQNSIVESLDQFYLSDSPTELSGGSWSTTATWTAGKYIWTRTRVIRYLDKDKANPYTYMPNETGTCITGNTGAQGEKGEKGDTGATGADGVSPTITTSKSGDTTTVTIKDASGTKTATITDGKDGEDADIAAAEKATAAANEAASKASSAATDATSAASTANTAASTASSAATNASNAASKATTAAGTADKAAATASSAASSATSAASSATSAASDATSAASKATTATSNADKAASTANTAASTANSAAAAASKVNATVSGTTLIVTDNTGKSTSVDTKGEKGDTGAQGIQGEQGEQGIQGADGTGIESVARHYALADAGTEASTLTPSTSWATTEPAYTAGKSLFFADLTTKTDGTTSWSAVSLSSSYTAATDAQETANSNVSGVPIVYYRLTDGSTPTNPGTDSTGWSTSIASATAQMTGGFTSGYRYWSCTYTLYGDGSHKWGDVTYAEVETTAATNEYNVKMAGQRFSYDSSGAHVIGLQSDGTIPAKVDITSDGMTVYRTVDGSTHDIAHFGYNATSGSAESRVGELSGAHTVTDTGGIHFYDGKAIESVADIDSNGNRLTIGKAKVTDNMQMASFAWFARGGHLSLRKVAADGS